MVSLIGVKVICKVKRFLIVKNIHGTQDKVQNLRDLALASSTGVISMCACVWRKGEKEKPIENPQKVMFIDTKQLPLYLRLVACI